MLNLLDTNRVESRSVKVKKKLKYRENFEITIHKFAHRAFYNSLGNTQTYSNLHQ